MDFEFCDEFAEFIHGTDEKQRHLVKKKAEERKHLVSLKKTDWFNLEEAKGREGLACTLVTLLHWKLSKGDIRNVLY